MAQLRKVFATDGTLVDSDTLGGTGHVIEDEGVDLTARGSLNFVGAGVTVTDDAANGRTVVTVPGAAASSGGGALVPVPISGTYTFAPRGSSAVTVPATAGEAWGFPYPINPGTTIAQLGFFVNGAGGAGETLRVAAYNVNATTGLPDGAPIVDTTIAVASTGYKWATVNAAVTGGAVWVFTCPTAASQTAAMMGHGVAIAAETRLPLSAGAMPLHWQLTGDMSAAFTSAPTVATTGTTKAAGFILGF